MCDGEYWWYLWGLFIIGGWKWLVAILFGCVDECDGNSSCRNTSDYVE